MAGVITEACIKCKHMECVEVCPVDAFYEGENMLVINPLECVDCGCCIEQCPIDAIVFENEPRAEPWIELNARYSKLWPNVTFNGRQSPADADQFRDETDKFARYFSPNPGSGDVGSPLDSARTGSCGKCSDKHAVSPPKMTAMRVTLFIAGLMLGTVLLVGSLVLAGMILFSFNPHH